MHQFRGRPGTPFDRAWRIEINVHAVRKIWSLLKYDLNSYTVVNAISGDERYRILPELLSVLLEDQLAKAFPGETGADMALSRADELVADGETFHAAHEAVTAEWADFSRLRGQRWNAEQLDRVQALLAKQAQVAELEVKAELDKMEAAADARLTPGNSSTTTPADSESPTSDT